MEANLDPAKVLDPTLPFSFHKNQRFQIVTTNTLYPNAATGFEVPVVSYLLRTQCVFLRTIFNVGLNENMQTEQKNTADYSADNLDVPTVGMFYD